MVAAVELAFLARFMENEHYDFFLSFSHPDREVAQKVYDLLTEHGYSVYYQHTHIGPGTDFLERMDHGLTLSDKLIAVLSPDYARSVFAMAELRAILVDDPSGAKGMIIPLLVKVFRPPRLIATRVFINLVDALADDKVLRDVLLGAIDQNRSISVPRIEDKDLPPTSDDRGILDFREHLSCGRRSDGIHFMESFRAAVNSSDWESYAENKVFMCMSELIENAYEHGCQGDDDVIVVDFSASSKTAWMLVKNGQPMTETSATRVRELLNTDTAPDPDTDPDTSRGLQIISGMGGSVRLRKDLCGVEVVLPLSRRPRTTWMTDNIMVARPQGYIDNSNAPEFEAQFADLEFRNIIVDCSRLDYASSVGLRVLMRLAKRLRGLEKELFLLKVNEALLEVLTIARFDKVAHIVTSIEEIAEYIELSEEDLGCLFQDD